jgi:hypothetical protein
MKKKIKEEFNRLKKVFERLVNHKKEQGYPSLIPVPVKNKKYT